MSSYIFRQYAVLTGEWIHPNMAQLKRTRNLTKSNSTIALRIRQPQMENDYFPAATASVAKEASISGILLRQLKQESMESWSKLCAAGVVLKKLVVLCLLENLDTDGLPPRNARNSLTKPDDNQDCFGYEIRRPRSTSPQPSVWRNSVGIVGA